MNYIKRDLEQTVRENLDMPEMIAILGPRQSGKTTLMRQIFAANIANLSLAYTECF